MIFAVEISGLFKTEDVRGAFDHAYEAAIASGAFAQSAGRFLGQAAARGAGGDAISGAHQDLGQLLDDLGVALNEEEGESFG